VAVVVDPADYPELLATLALGAGTTGFAFRARLAAKAFAHTAAYDALVADYLSRSQQDKSEAFPQQLGIALTRVATLRYGENPHQQAAFYRSAGAASDCIAGARLVQGKELSFNNIADADTALPIPAEPPWLMTCATPTKWRTGRIPPPPLAASSPSTGHWMQTPRR
jgi:phosphoribosylaminoimidazolecarboxamide formyltransferase/IMP cyclohydrolase